MDPVPSGQGESKILFEVESCDVLGFRVEGCRPKLYNGTTLLQNRRASWVDDGITVAMTATLCRFVGPALGLELGVGLGLGLGVGVGLGLGLGVGVREQ